MVNAIAISSIDQSNAAMTVKPVFYHGSQCLPNTGAS